MSLPPRPMLVAGALGIAAIGALYYATRTPPATPATANKAVREAVCGDGDLDSLLAVLRAELELSWPQLVTIRENFLREMRDGLARDGESSMAMVPSLVTALPSGDEVGFSVALDVGGSNLRALLVELKGNGSLLVREPIVKRVIGTALQQGEGEALFDFIASAVKELIEAVPELAKSSAPIDLGFTFSFPLKQTAINAGILTTWTKGFNASGVVGQDVCSLLRSSLDRLKLPHVRIAALLNDTVGTMVAGAYEQRTRGHTEAGCIAGLILGTGTNACYWEQLSHLTKLGADSASTGGMIINMECGNFGSRPGRIGTDLPLSRFDASLNAGSLNKDRQLIEKQISGMYLGELVRLVLRDAIAKGKLCKASPSALSEPNALSTETMAAIASDASPSLEDTGAILARLGCGASSLAERRFVREVADLIATRSARLAAVKIAAIARQMNLGERSASVAVDGSLFEKYPRYHATLSEALFQLTRNRRIELVLTKDGSGVGAAIAAFVIAKKAKEAASQ